MERQATDTAGREPVILRLGPFDRHGTTRVRYGGRSIEVEHGIPGEVVRVEIVGKQRQRGRILSVIEAAPDRVTSPCVYFREWSCGGCQWQMISYDGQLERKRLEVDRVMRAAGLELSVESAYYLDDPWRYRSTAGISLGKRAGFRRQASLAIVPIRDCPISHPLIGELMATLNDAIDAGAVPDYRGRVRIEVRVVDGDAGAGLLTLVQREDDEAAGAGLDPLIEALTRSHFVAGVSVRHADDTIEVISGDLFGEVIIAGRPVTVSAAAFLQTDLRLLPDLLARLKDEAEPLAGKRVADVYGGIGIFGLTLAPEAAEILVIEPDEVAIQAGERTAASRELANMRFLAERAEDALGDQGPFDIMIVDPPRSGLNVDVMAAIIRAPPPLLLYVSCLAESLARDLAILTDAGYRVDSLELFDFYPQTYHVELLAVLRR